MSHAYVCSLQRQIHIPVVLPGAPGRPVIYNYYHLILWRERILVTFSRVRMNHNRSGEEIIPMPVSLEQVQQWVKAWVVGVDPEVAVQVLPPHDNPRDVGEVIPVRLARLGYQMTVAFPERSVSESGLPEETCRTLEQMLRLLRYMETRGLRRPGQEG